VHCGVAVEARARSDRVWVSARLVHGGLSGQRDLWVSGHPPSRLWAPNRTLSDFVPHRTAFTEKPETLPSGRYAHSPESWERLWKATFAEIEGAEWVDKHVRITCGLFKEVIPYLNKLVPDYHSLHWMVEIV